MFDLIHEREVLLGDCGYAFDLGADFEEAKAVGGRGNSAHAFLGTAIQCLLVGFEEPALQLLTKAKHWVTASLAEREIPKRYLHDERYSSDGEAAIRYQTLALCNWLLHDQHDTQSLERFVELEDRFMASSKAGRDKVSVALVLPSYVDAGAYHRALDLFLLTPGLAPPKSLGSIRNEAQMSYVLCRHRLNQEYSRDEITLAVRKFLQKNVSEWLGRGHFVRVAEWMKIVLWQGGTAGISARSALLNCLEHVGSKT
jgi:hypothetical protein